MLVLAIDTATKACAVGLCRDGKILAEYKINMGMTHSEGPAHRACHGRSAGLRMAEAFAGCGDAAGIGV